MHLNRLQPGLRTFLACAIAVAGFSAVGPSTTVAEETGSLGRQALVVDYDYPNPGSPLTEAASTALQAEPPPPSHPVVAELLNQLNAKNGLGKNTHEDDVAAVAAYYAVTDAKPVWTNADGFSDRANRAMATIREADDWGLKAAHFDLPAIADSSPDNSALASAELKLALAVLTYARHARGGRLRPSAVSRLFDQKPEIIKPLALLKDLSSASKTGAYLKRLHPQHPQFERLRFALIEARKPKSAEASLQAKKKAGAKKRQRTATINQLLANMERWRWIPNKLGNLHVWNDVPAQMASVFADGEVVFRERIVVGKPATPTPMFSADMKYIIFHPSWGVPPGMRKNELLPKLRRTGGGTWFTPKPKASSLLRAHQLQVSYRGRPINPDTVDWKTANIANYHFSQPPGPRNVLGVVKFRYPNRHNVYMHDTPERHLFRKKTRAFSHGCLRVQNPIRLAEVLLEHDKGWDKNTVRSKKRRGASITLSSPVPVHTAYFTVSIGDDGKHHIYRDLYGVDRRTISKLNRGTVTTTAVSKRPSKRIKRKTYRKKKRKKRRTAKKQEPTNFMSLFGN